jgi:hypothetical protein
MVLDEVPPVSIQVFEYGNSAIRFCFWRPNKMNSLCTIVIVITPEIIGLQEKKDPPARLVTDAISLFFIHCFCEE